MFIKPFKSKNNTQIKSTERKKLRTKIESSFKLGEDELNKLLPNKSTLNQLKLIAYSGQLVNVYTCDRRPMFFEFSPSGDETKTVILPTVYSLWISPDMVPLYTTQPAVLPRLAGGADLMLPGLFSHIFAIVYYTLFFGSILIFLFFFFRYNQTRYWLFNVR